MPSITFSLRTLRKIEAAYMEPQSTQRNSLCTQKDFPLKDVTEKIISCALEVHSTIGPGLLESIYDQIPSMSIVLFLFC